jgi:hypothetical protein
LKRFVDDIAIEVIESKLISPLHNIFSPITVTSMSADLVTCIAGESEENRAQREQLNKQLEVLTKGIETCRRFAGVRIIGEIVPGLSIRELSLIRSGGVDDSTVQSENTSNSTDYGPRDSDEASDHSASDDGRSLLALSDRGVSPPMGYPVPVPVPAPRMERAGVEEIFSSSEASKKDIKRANFVAQWGYT